MATLQGMVRGRTIELNQDAGLPEGQVVSVDIRPIVARAASETAMPSWLDHLDVDPSVRVGKFVVTGTRLLADDLLAQVHMGSSDDALLRRYPELKPDDLAALHEYGKVPVELRRCFGAWAEESTELDEYLQWTREHRKTSRRRIED